MPLREWPGTRGKILAGRVAGRLGARQLATRLHLQAWRADPGDAFAHYYHANWVFSWRGPLAAWEFLQRDGRPDGETPLAVRADLLALRARCLAGLRDFERAERELARAEELSPDRAWLMVERSGVLAAEDRYAEALASSARALEARPWFGPAVLQHAQLLVLCEQDARAVDFLGQALERIEDAASAGLRATMLVELGRHDEAWPALDRLEELAVLADRGLREWIAAQRSELGYLRGDAEAALAWARLADTSFHRLVVQSLERSPRVTRKCLPVAFVRQHHMTCGPASLTAIARYFEQPTDHLELAEQICYGGTTNYSERRWAEENGFVAREFTVTEAGVRALVDRGLPCAVSTVESVTGHMQVIIGYDANRGTFLVRDPYLPTRSEWMAQEFLQNYRAFGPRGLVLVPRARAGELADLELESSALYDHLYRLQAALQSHDWTAAEAAQHALETEAPGHRLAHEGRLALAGYAQDPLGGLAAVEAWLASFPGNARLLHVKLMALGELGRRADRLELLTSAVGTPRADFVFRFELARELAEDGRTRAEAERHVRHALRRAPQNAGCMWLIGRLASGDGDAERAFELMRFAVCLEDTNEGLAQGFFGAGFNAGRAEEALALLAARFERFARRSSLPARSLFHALDALRRTDEAFAVLDRALAARPEDGSLLLFAAVEHANRGRAERAQELLGRAGTRARATEVLRTRADLAVLDGDLPAALAHCRAWTEREPLALEAHRRVLWLLRATEGRARELEEVRALAARHPFHAGIQRLCLGELGVEHPAEAETLLAALIERHPTDAWARRELALRRMQQGKLAEALAGVREVHPLDPRDPISHALEGAILEEAGRGAEATAAVRAAVALSADYVPGLKPFVHRSWQQGEGPAALAFALECLRAQRTNGDGVLAWWEMARARLEPAEVLATLTALRTERPELWQVNVALVRHLLGLGRSAEALEAARAGCARLPLHHEVWLALAEVHQARADAAEEERALESALALSPHWSEALRRLALLHEKRGELEHSRRILERAVVVAPLDAQNHGWLADTLLQLGLPDVAVARAEHALRLAPNEAALWNQHVRCAQAAGRPGRTLELLRASAAARPRDPSAWVLLATFLDPAQVEERLDAARRAHAADPGHHEAADLLVRLLGEQGRIGDALAVLEGIAARGELSLPLRGRRAWLIGEAGRPEEAVELLSELVRLDPDYAWGWRQLGHILARLGRHAKSRDALAALVRLAPADPVPHLLLGSMQTKLGRRAEAKDSFRQALALNPAFTAAAESLLDLLLEERRIDEAHALVEATKPHWTAELRAVQPLRVACAAKDEARVRAGFQDLLRDRALDPWAVGFVAGLMKGSGLDTLRAELVEAALADGRHEAGELWILDEIERSGWGKAYDNLRALAPGRATTLGATLGFLDAAAERRQLRLGRKLIEERSKDLDGHVLAWGTFGRFWLIAGDARRCVRWMGDWQRPDARPWMLLNLGLARRRLGDHAEAVLVTRRALELAPDHTVPLHHVLAAADELLAGHLDAARRHLSRAGSGERRSYFEFLHRVLAATLTLDASPDPRAAFPATQAAFAGARRLVRDLRKEHFLRTLQLASSRLVARRLGSLRGWLWWAGQRL